MQMQFSVPQFNFLKVHFAVARNFISFLLFLQVHLQVILAFQQFGRTSSTTKEKGFFTNSSLYHINCISTFRKPTICLS